MALSTVMHATILALIAENLGLPITPQEKPPVPLAVVLGSPGNVDDERIDTPGAEESQTTATEPRYATGIRFDPRLESRRPPGFPVTDRY
jgi:hypothetical protein